ncbi:SDR family oxidoreductase [Lentisphaera profundi]|uniref:SDR family oxidoreductase n=1 Tax=Lentisphaera profundi TaxID=1658616 RepID=A0ABY7VMR8_9BACT|nr:SDR family oxidoreductase [Lentisphaera profundi]WDE95325.1 SDR family oxidoreductase [Lentisphaera profundi]
MNKYGLIYNAKVLITGGAGFIGSNLVDSLLEQGNLVRVLDDFSTGFESNLEKHYNFADQKSINQNFELIRGDIRDQEVCAIACEGIDYVFHQAALGSVPRSINDPILTNSVNITGFLNMLTASRDAKIKRFIYAASSSTYGDSKDLPKVEDNIGKPLSPYAVTKYVNELYADVYYKTYGLETMGLRYFNVYGRRQTPDGAYAAVIPLFVDHLIKHQSPQINGDGGTSRDFTYIDNVIKLNQLAALSSDEASFGQVFNCACGDSTSLNELFNVLRTELSKFDADIAQVEVNYGPERAGDIRDSLADISKAKSLLKYDDIIGFEQGIKDCVQWYWDNLK